ncbi:MAG: RsbRD N-terminal domain-containing protein [Bryobacteraceae bacterium]
MLSGRLIRLIEDHQEQIATNVIREIRRRPELSAFRKLSDAELRERGQQILENLGAWLAMGQEAEIVRLYETIGKSRFEQGIPLHESVRALAIIKDKMIDFMRFQGFARTSVDLYAEEELERTIWRFFDELTVRMVRGYETAWGRAAHAAA